MDYVQSRVTMDLDMDEAMAIELLDYGIRSHAAIAFGPFSTIYHGVEVIGTPSGETITDAVRIEMGALGMTYGYLALLNYIQGPKYAMAFWKLHESLNPARNLVIRHGGAPALAAAAQFELSKTKISNVSMDPIPGVAGAYSNPMGGSSDNEFYYPGKGILEWIFG